MLLCVVRFKNLDIETS